MRVHFTDTNKLSAFAGARRRALVDSQVQNMHRRLIDTECGKVCEGTGDAVLERDGLGRRRGHRRLAERERTAPQA